MNIFVTGATGYIGGSVAKTLVDNGHKVYGLVRNPEKVRGLANLGVDPVLGDINDSTLLIKYAKMSDAVINAANSDHWGAVESLVQALKDSGKVLIHTSGSSIVADDACGAYASETIYDEQTHFIPTALRECRVALNDYVLQQASTNDIKSMVVTPSMIYGDALGVQARSDQIPKLIDISKKAGAGIYIGSGLNRWSNVHIKDLVNLYLLLLDGGHAGKLFFVENGEESLFNIAQSIATAIGYPGVLASWPIEKAVEIYGDWARFAIGSNSRVSAVNARNYLGWQPVEQSILDWIEG